MQGLGGGPGGEGKAKNLGLVSQGSETSCALSTRGGTAASSTGAGERAGARERMTPSPLPRLPRGSSRSRYSVLTSKSIMRSTNTNASSTVRRLHETLNATDAEAFV